MINTLNVYVIAIHGRDLLRRNGNCGRSLRRFLSRIVSNNILSQIFLPPKVGENGPESLHDRLDFNCVKAYAARVHRYNLAGFDFDVVTDDVLVPIGTVECATYLHVANAYQVNIDIGIASLKELRKLLCAVVCLAENLQGFAYEPEAAVSLLERDTEPA